MKNFNNCVDIVPCTDCVLIKCKLGLWKVQGPYGKEVYKQAEKKYRQYRDLGNYKSIIKAKEKTDANSIRIRSKKK